MPAAVFVVSEVIREMKRYAGVPELQYCYMCFIFQQKDPTGLSGRVIRNTSHCTVNSKRLCQGQNKKMGLMNKLMKMGHILGQEQRLAFMGQDKMERGLIK